MIASPKNFIEQFQNFIEHIAGVMKTFLTKEKADNYYLGKTAKAVSAGTADTAGSATKATQDANGNVIPEMYATKSELTSGLATKQPVGDYRTKSELDSIYLGINAKAKSAETADLANDVAGSVVVGRVVGNVGVQGGPFISSTANPYTVTADAYATVNITIRNYDDYAYNYRFTGYVDGATYASSDKRISANKSASLSFSAFVRKGQKISGSAQNTDIGSGYSPTFSVQLSPVYLYAISEEESE